MFNDRRQKTLHWLVYRYIIYFVFPGIGLGNWKVEDYPELEQKLSDCYAKGHEYLPKGATNTPIWFGATAGMRILK